MRLSPSAKFEVEFALIVTIVKHTNDDVGVQTGEGSLKVYVYTVVHTWDGRCDFGRVPLSLGFKES